MRNELAVAIAISVLALVLRLWGISYDLPFIYYPDEPGYVAIAQRIFKTGDLNPHFFNYPSLFFYLNAASYIPYYVAGALAGEFSARTDIAAPLAIAVGVAKATQPNTILLGRCLTALFGAGTVALTWMIGRRISGRASVGLLAALFLAVSPPNVSNSRLITPDTFVVFFAAAAVLGAVRIHQRGRISDYVFAGAALGLTASSKYNGALVAVPVLMAHVPRVRKIDLSDRRLWWLAGACAMAFLFTTPYALLDLRHFAGGIRYEGQHYATGHPGMEGGAFAWYVRYAWTTAALIYVLAVLEMIRGALSKAGETAILASFPIVYFAFIALFVVRNDRTLLPLTPMIAILAASQIVRLGDMAGDIQTAAFKKAAFVAALTLAVLAVAQPALRSIQATRQLLHVKNSGRETARLWIDANLPHGASIAMESYSPFVDPTIWNVTTFWTLIDHEPEWYAENSVEYLVFAQGAYGRYFEDIERYPSEVERYNRLFSRFTRLIRFADGGYEVLIYRVEPARQTR
jgi:4-amino-4-deoxy-L-arabinose transferase-like glycosyltransferase